MGEARIDSGMDLRIQRGDFAARPSCLEGPKHADVLEWEPRHLAPRRPEARRTGRTVDAVAQLLDQDLQEKSAFTTLDWKQGHAPCWNPSLYVGNTL